MSSSHEAKYKSKSVGSLGVSPISTNTPLKKTRLAPRYCPVDNIAETETVAEYLTAEDALAKAEAEGALVRLQTYTP